MSLEQEEQVLDGLFFIFLEVHSDSRLLESAAKVNSSQFGCIKDPFYLFMLEAGRPGCFFAIHTGPGPRDSLSFFSLLGRMKGAEVCLQEMS